MSTPETNNKPSSRKPDIFVGGPPRSGTTILQKILCKSRYTNPMVGEAQHFFNLIQAYDSALHLFDTKTKFYFSRKELFQYHKKMADDYLHRFRSKFGEDTRLVMKCPGYSKYLPHIANLIPDSQFVLIVRDTLDIVASQIEVGEKQRSLSGTCDYPRENLQYVVNRINLIYFPVIRNKKLFGKRLIIVKYENLVSRKSALERLSDLLQLPDLVNVSQENDNGLRDFKNDSDRAHYSKFWERNLTNSRIGRYKEVLTSREIDAVRKTTRKLRDMFGYD